MENVKKITIGNMPFWIFLPVFVLTIIATYTGALTKDIIGSFSFLFVVGSFLFYIGKKIPVLNKWAGTAILLPLFGGSVMIYFNLIPNYIVQPINSLMSSGFINVYIAAVVVGSILSMNRKILLQSAWRVIPVIVLTQLVVVLFLFLGGLIVNKTALQSIFLVGLPTYAGGSSGALVAVPSIYKGIFNHPIGYYAGQFMVLLNINNLFCIIFCAILNQFAKKHQNLTGNGNLLKGEANSNLNQKNEKESSEDEQQTIKSLGTGFFLCLFFFVVGGILEHLIPQINAIAWGALIAIVVKSTGILNESICHTTKVFEDFMIHDILPVVLLGISISSIDLKEVVEFINLPNIFILFMGVVGSIVGSWIIGLLFKFNPIDSVIGIGLQIGNLGGSGNIATLTAGERMELMPFATIANRIGGALMLVWISLLIPLFV